MHVDAGAYAYGRAAFVRVRSRAMSLPALVAVLALAWPEPRRRSTAAWSTRALGRRSPEPRSPSSASAGRSGPTLPAAFTGRSRLPLPIDVIVVLRRRPCRPADPGDGLRRGGDLDAGRRRRRQRSRHRPRRRADDRRLAGRPRPRYLTSRTSSCAIAQTLSQALDVVPGVSTISEGQAAVPTIRGLARGRTLILVDGSRASTERRAGANASFLDPAIVRTIEVARGPGSVAYGSDAFGGVIAARTRAPDHARPLRVRFAGDVGSRRARDRAAISRSQRDTDRAACSSRSARATSTTTTRRPASSPNSAWRDSGARARWEHATGADRWSVGWQSDFGRALGRPRSDGDVIRATSPYEDSHRLTASYERAALGGFRNVRFDGLVRHRSPAQRPGSAAHADASAEPRARGPFSPASCRCGSPATAPSVRRGCTSAPTSRAATASKRWIRRSPTTWRGRDLGDDHRLDRVGAPDGRRGLRRDRRATGPVGADLGRAARGRRQQHERWRILWRSLDHERGAGRPRCRYADADGAADDDRSSGPRLPRPDPVGPVLSRTGRPRVHRR